MFTLAWKLILKWAHYQFETIHGYPQRGRLDIKKILCNMGSHPKESAQILSACVMNPFYALHKTRL